MSLACLTSAVSSPQTLLVLCHYRAAQADYPSEPFETLLDDDFPRIAELDDLKKFVVSPKQEKELPKAYSYTGDYLAYRTCHGRYMIYRRCNSRRHGPDNVFRQPCPPNRGGSAPVAPAAG